MDFEFPRGDTKLFKFKLKDANGEDLQLAEGDKLYFTVKTSPNTSVVSLQKTLSNGITYGQDGYYHISITSDDTAELQYGQYGYDIELKTASGTVKTLIIGTLTLTEEYTFKGDES